MLWFKAVHMTSFDRRDWFFGLRAGDVVTKGNNVATVVRFGGGNQVVVENKLDEHEVWSPDDVFPPDLYERGAAVIIGIIGMATAIQVTSPSYVHGSVTADNCYLCNVYDTVWFVKRRWLCDGCISDHRNREAERFIQIPEAGSVGKRYT